MFNLFEVSKDCTIYLNVTRTRHTRQYLRVHLQFSVTLIQSCSREICLNQLTVTRANSVPTPNFFTTRPVVTFIHLAHTNNAQPRANYKRNRSACNLGRISGEYLGIPDPIHILCANCFFVPLTNQDEPIYPFRQ